MTPFTIIALVCAIGLDHSACQLDTARASAVVGRVASEIECGKIGQSQIAATAAEVRPEPGKEYLKIVCQRKGS